MAMGKNCGLGLVKRTSSFGRKRIVMLNDMEIDSIEAGTSPTKKRCFENKSVFGCERSLLEALPQDVLIRILCGVEHEDLKSLFHVSKPIREAALIAKRSHFAYTTPRKVQAFRCPLNIESSSIEFDEIEAPNAPRQSRFPRSRLTRKKLADLSVALFASPMNENGEDTIERPKRDMFMDMEP